MTAGGSDTEVGEAMDDRSITKPPEVLFFNHSPVKLKALSSLCLTCELDGIPEPDIKWFRNGQILFDGRDGYQIRRINFGKWSLYLNQTTKVQLRRHSCRLIENFRIREAIMRYQFQMHLVQQWPIVELLWIILLHYQV